MKKRALVIDDEQIVLDSIFKILTEEDFEVATTLNGAEGIRYAVNEPYDVILTDIRMPDIDGFQVIRDIRKSKASVPIVMITGYATVSSAVQAMKLGATNYIEKPFSPEELIRIVVSAMEDSSGESCEDQTIIHRKEVLKILKKGAADRDFAKRLFADGADALENYDLTSQEKLAFITADIDWIEDQIGIIQPDHKQWLIEGKKR
ncbi:MAG: response regulator [Desulfobacteraceae bacterium]|nr:response regulator [Desulfobacteraceae bacterium]MBC2756122.1 response regulator [Desulfobacteraceae bacterium]